MSRSVARMAALAVVALIACIASTPCQAMSIKRSPLPYRIVSFHKGKMNKDILRSAAKIGYNGAMVQLESGNVQRLQEFAELDRKEGYVELCHSLGMKVTLWVHELENLPGANDTGYLGPVTLENDKLWKHLEDRYDYVLGELLPDIDGIVLTVVETQIGVTDTKLMLKLVDVLRGKCQKYKKQLIVRTFVWYPKEFEGVMGCVKQMPDDVVIMSKCVPQDWQLRGMNDRAIGDVGNHQQIVEYDAAGEYFLEDSVANCMVDYLKDQFEYGLKHGVDGVCVRVDRGHANVLHAPQEVNMWALGLFANADASTADQVWNAWATARYGRIAAPGVIKALKPTLEVMREMVNIGSFSLGRPGPGPPAPDKDSLSTNWANFKWDRAYLPEYRAAQAGEPAYTSKVAAQKKNALVLAQRCLVDLEEVKSKLSPEDYEVLKSKLFTNKVQLEWRAPMMLAYLRYNRVRNTSDETEETALAKLIRADLAKMREVANRQYPPSRELDYLGKKWQVGAPGDFEPKRINEWADKMEALLKAKGLNLPINTD